MIAGTVDSSLVAWTRLTLSGPSGQQDVDARVDTGFNGFLSVPLGVLLALGLAPAGSSQISLADGSTVFLPTYYVTIDWDGRQRTVQADGTSDLCLVGMSLMEGHDLSIRIRVGGALTIQAIP
jgi:clan AA aspartic protease